jgi:XTP/dITP diphosphohydrolase
MTVLGATPALRLMTAASFLETPFTATQAFLITQIETEESFRKIGQVLMAHLPSSYQLQILGDLTAEQSLTFSIAEFSHPPLQPFPIHLYVPCLVQQLTAIVAQLRNPKGGCPWDLAQTPTTLIPYIIEEAYETVAAIRQDNVDAIAEELGDLLLQVVLQAQIASETEQFTLQTVADGIARKLIRRHPHVFSNLSVDSVDEVHANWERIKAMEKGIGTEPQLSAKLQRYTQQLPPLMAGVKVSQKAAAAGFEWPDLEGVWAKFYEELAEFQEALLQGNTVHQEAELGDLIFTLVNIARWCQLDPSAALHQTHLKLVERIQVIESVADRPLTDYSLAELEALWQSAKRSLDSSLPSAEGSG